MYQHLEKNGLLADEQKGRRKGSRGTKDQLLIDKVILKNCRRRLTNLSMAWIDYKKAYDMVPHSWILRCLEIVGGAKNIINIISNSMVNWMEDSINIRRNRYWASGHKQRNLPRRLFITIVVYSNHAATDPSATKDESWIQICKGHDTRQPPTVYGRSEIIWSQQRLTKTTG